MPFDNQGNVDVDAGTLTVRSLDNAAAGDVTTASGTVLDVEGALEQGGSLTLLGKSTVAAASFHQSGGVTLAPGHGHRLEIGAGGPHRGRGPR